MTCHRINFGNGAVGIVCTARSRTKPCLDCQGARPGVVLCDFPLGLTGRTCDRPLCERCKLSWNLAAPVQLEPRYRKKHGQGDLCRIHEGMVAKGWGPAFLVLCTLLRPDRAAAFRAAGLEALPALLDAGPAEATAYIAKHPSGPAATRVQVLGAAMSAIAVSLRAAGDPVAVYEAEKAARTTLATLASRS